MGLIGTVEIRYADERERSVNTTPESLDLQRTLRAMRTRDVETVVMEVSSHGLELGRVDGCRFDVGAGGQRDPGPPRFSRDHGRLPGLQGAAVRSLPRARRHRRGESGRPFGRGVPGGVEARRRADRPRLPRCRRAAPRSSCTSANVDLDGTRAEIDHAPGRPRRRAPAGRRLQHREHAGGLRRRRRRSA